MEDGDTEKYHASSLIQDFVSSSRKMGCIRCISSQVYNNKKYCLKHHNIKKHIFRNDALKFNYI